jgi:hypothetical protein
VSEWSERPMWWKSEADRVVNKASYAAAVRIYEHAALYHKGEDYRPLGELARAIQRVGGGLQVHKRVRRGGRGMSEHAYCLDHRSHFCPCVAAWMYGDATAASWFEDAKEDFLDCAFADETPANEARGPQGALWR